MTETKSPQLEDGYIRVANELFDAILRAKLKYSTQTVLLVVLRKTYGYGKKEDDMSASQIGELCGMSRQHVTTALNELADMNIISKRPGVYGAIVGINKDYSQWKAGSPNLGQVSKTRTKLDSTKSGQVSESRTSSDSPNLGQVDSPNLGHTKDNLSKEYIPPIPPRGESVSETKNEEIDMPEDFLKAWGEYPKRDGANPRRDALKAWRARVREGVSPDDLLRATKAYAAAMERKVRVGTEFVMQAQRFYGKSRPYEDYLTAADADEWWKVGGFSSQFEAENMGFNKYKAQEMMA